MTQFLAYLPSNPKWQKIPKRFLYFIIFQLDVGAYNDLYNRMQAKIETTDKLKNSKVQLATEFNNIMQWDVIKSSKIIYIFIF